MDFIKIQIYWLSLMGKFKKFIARNWFFSSIVLLILFAAILRFYNYENRWGLAYDQAHDALVARYALEAHKIPLVGPFSSAGPFQSGGEWYWFIMAATAFYPNAVITPWVILTLFHVLFVLLIIFVGKELVNKKFGLIVGLLATVSTAQIAQATNLTNQSPLAIVALCAIWSMIIYVKTKKLKYLFLLALFVSLAPTIHLQGTALIILVPITIIFTRPPFVKGIIALLLGIFIPLVPIILFDLNNNFVNSHSMLQYYFYDQYKISLDVLGRRWLTFIGIFLPNAWSHIIGGNLILGYIAMILSAVAIVYNFLKSQLSKEWYILVISFLGMLVLVRYTRTPIFDSFIVFIHPFILLFTALAIFSIYKKNVALGLSFLFLIAIGSLFKDIKEIKLATNYAAPWSREQERALITNFPNHKLAIYDFKNKTTGESLPLVLFLYTNKKIDDGGIKLGVVIATSGAQFKYPIVFGDKEGYKILNLNNSNNTQLRNEGWIFINPSQVYKSTEEWYSRSL